MRENPFFNKNYHTPHNTAPFNRILLEDYEPAILEGIRQDDAFIQRIIDNPEPPTFDNTIAITTPDDMLERVTKVFFNLLSAETNDEMDELAQKMSPILTEHANNIIFNKRYFERVKAVWEQYHQPSTLTPQPSPPTPPSPRPLTPEEQMLLEKAYDGFIRAGAALDEAGQTRLREINNQMSLLTLQFSQNRLKATNAYQLHITDEADLSGLPDSAREAAALAAKEQGKEGWLFTLQAPSYGPFITYADNRELRRQMYMAKNTICVQGTPFDNETLVAQIVNLRQERAKLLGYKTFADYVLKERMAETADNVYHLLDQLLEAYMPTAHKEVQEIEDMAHRLEGENFELQPWDFSYYGHKLKKERYDIDAEMLRPYLQLARVKEGVFGLATRLYGITFRENKDIPVYHPDVQAYEVLDQDGSFLAVLYTDFYPRKGKQAGAWMTSFKEQWIGPSDEDPKRMENSRPHVSLVMNFTKPTETKPALLTLGEVETFLHEFGHALHGIFANTRFASLSGTSVYWDFVELPSQLMENFAVEPDFLNTFAAHYETGEPIPADLIQRIIDSRNFQVAYACIRQVSFGLLDMAYYTLTEPFSADVKAFESKAWERAQLLKEIPGTCMTVQFGHIMSGGYAAGYYSYKWAEVLDADAFAVFKEHGIFDRETAQRFRDCILSRGGTEHPMTLYKRFRGSEPTIDALLKRNGIKRPTPDPSRNGGERLRSER